MAGMSAARLSQHNKPARKKEGLSAQETSSALEQKSLLLIQQIIAVWAAALFQRRMNVNLMEITAGSHVLMMRKQKHIPVAQEKFAAVQNL